MATSGLHPLREKPHVKPDLPPLEPGDHLDQPTFHARYEAMPQKLKAELIGGVVYMPAALRRPHGRHHSLLTTWLGVYEAHTPGTEAFNNATVVLGDESEPQPDCSLIVVGGQTAVTPDDYIAGPPEFVAEIASSSESYDLHAKRSDYERLGVQEYLVLIVRQQRVLWLARGGKRRKSFHELTPGDDRLLRSRAFPGLWLDPTAFFQNDARKVLDTLHQGLNSDEHTRFVQSLPPRKSK